MKSLCDNQGEGEQQDELAQLQGGWSPASLARCALEARRDALQHEIDCIKEELDDLEGYGAFVQASAFHCQRFQLFARDNVGR